MRCFNFLRPLAISLLSLPAILAGCAGNGDALNQSLSAYNAGKYDESYSSAQTAAQSARTTKDSDEAAYLAGMSAYRLNKPAEAAKLLENPARSSDAWIAGQAGITLGTALAKTGRRSEAARAFARAATHLDGEEADKAHLAAANAFQAVGDTTNANEQFRLAKVPVPTSVSTASAPIPAPGPTPPKVAGPRPGTVAAPPVPGQLAGQFVLQAGAFRDVAKARRRAQELKTKAARAGLGEPTVVAKRGSDGATLHVVQLGSFADRRAADSAMTKLGASGVVVGRPAAPG